MNYTESFDQFASRLTPTDLALYAGAGLVIFILFKDKLKLSPVQEFISSLMTKVKNKTESNTNTLPSLTTVSVVPSLSKDDLFFDLVSSWKQTRDLAVKCGCDDAVKAADEMFPYLSPVVCAKKGDVK